jgi:uncharacterized RDD family membrane protein YckC
MSLGTSIVSTVSSDDYSRLSGYVPSGFWHRFFAFVIDGIVVAIPCFAIAEVFQAFFTRSPGWAAFSGFVVTTSYFAVFGSKVVDGQTLGMMATRVKVVAADGATISLQRSFLRYAILFAPFLLTSAILPKAAPSAIAAAYDTVMGFAGIAETYLAFLNHRTGQLLHDLATDTFVVDSPGAGSVYAEPFWKPHWAILLGLFALASVLTLTIPHVSGDFGELTLVENAVTRTPGATHVSVELNVSGSGRSGIIVKTGCDQISLNHNLAAARLAAAVLNGDPKVSEHDYLEIDCVTTLQVGFFKSTNTDPFSRPPREWQALTQN